jgi:hypothetical protein
MCHQNIRRLNVAMHNIEFCQMIEGYGNLAQERTGFLPRQGPAFLHQASQGRARYVFHDQKMYSAILAAIMHGNHMWMLNTRSNFRFSLKATDQVGVCGCFAGQHLDRHGALQSLMLGLIDDTKGASTQTANETTTAQDLTNQTVLWGSSSQAFHLDQATAMRTRHLTPNQTFRHPAFVATRSTGKEQICGCRWHGLPYLPEGPSVQSS